MCLPFLVFLIMAKWISMKQMRMEGKQDILKVIILMESIKVSLSLCKERVCNSVFQSKYN